VKARIRERLTELEKEHGFQVLYACESGSRAWGFASADSDYDVRFLFHWPKERYLEIFLPADHLDLGVDAENLDLSGWDLRKALRLFAKSNGPLCEWLYSPEVYLEDSRLMTRWKGLTNEVFCPKANAYHYVGLGKNISRTIYETGEVTAKKYLYALRATLAARYVLETKEPAPVEFSVLLERANLEANLRSEIAEMIAAKADGAEADAFSRSECLDEFIEASLATLGTEVEALPHRSVPMDQLDTLFLEALDDDS